MFGLTKRKALQTWRVYRTGFVTTCGCLTKEQRAAMRITIFGGYPNWRLYLNFGTSSLRKFSLHVLEDQP